MSGKIVGLSFELDLGQRDKFVLIALADHADHNGHNAFPSVDLLASKTGYARRTVQKALRSLEDAGIIVPTENEEGGRGRSTNYSIYPEKGELATPFKDEKGESDDVKGEPEYVKGESEYVKGESDDASISNRQETSNNNRPNNQESLPGPTPSEFKDYWNDRAEEAGVAYDQEGNNDLAISRMTSGRTDKLRTRREETLFVENWEDIIERAFSSSFLLDNRSAGPGEYSFFSVNWLLRNEENYTKVYEGQYRDDDPEEDRRHYGGSEQDRRDDIDSSTSIDNAEWLD